MKQRWIAPPTPPLRSVEKIEWSDYCSVYPTEIAATNLASLLRLEVDAATKHAGCSAGAMMMLADLSPAATRRALDHMACGADEDIDVDLVRIARDLRINAVVLGCLWHLFDKRRPSEYASIETSIDWSASDARHPTPEDPAQDIETMFDDVKRHLAVRHHSSMRLANPMLQWCGVEMPAVHAHFDLTALSLAWDGIVLYLSSDRISDTLLARHHGRPIKDLVPHPLLPDDANLVDHRAKRGVQALITDRTPRIGSWREAADMHLLR